MAADRRLGDRPLGRAARSATHILVVDTRRGKVAHKLQLAGKFRVETISTAGDFLFLQQDFPDGSYAVRGYDLAAGQMLPGWLGEGETSRCKGSRPRSWRRPTAAGC